MKLDKNNRNNLVVALDIGTTKICAVAGYKNMHNQIEIAALAKVASDGVRRGVVSNIDRTVKAIDKAIMSISEQLDMNVKDLYIGIAGQHISSFHFQGIDVRQNSAEEISHKDIDKLIADMHKISLSPGDLILHVIPQEFTVDSEMGIIDPIGMSGSRLEANFHIITAQASAFNNISRCVEKSRLNSREMILEPLASAASVLTKEELEAGVVLVDIGGGTTDIAIFHEGIIRHTAVFPFGGNTITNDVKKGCTVMIDQAEKLKTKFGSALSEELKNNRIITIPGLKGHAEREITEKNLSKIIQARVEEIFDLVYWEIQKSGYEDKLIGGIVLTGGGAMLKNIKNLSELNTGLKTRIGEPTEYLAQGYEKRLTNPLYATSIGLLIRGIEAEEKLRSKVETKEKFETPVLEASVTEVKEEVKPSESQGGNRLVSRFKKVLDFFESTPDSDF